MDSTVTQRRAEHDQEALNLDTSTCTQGPHTDFSAETLAGLCVNAMIASTNAQVIRRMPKGEVVAKVPLWNKSI